MVPAPAPGAGPGEARAQEGEATVEEAGAEVLLLGEANFSFTLALAGLLEQRGAARRPAGEEEAEEGARAAEAYLQLPPRALPGARLLATSFEAPEEEVVRKYPEAAGVLSRLKACHGGRVEVRHGVNAWDLRGSFGDDARWDVIAWNHPHLGTEDCRLHRFLLAHFLAAAGAALREGGRVVLSLVEGQAERWELAGQAARTGLQLLACEPFAARDFPGYECKRNTTGKSFKNLHSQRHTTDVMRSWTYHLGRTAAAGTSLPSSATAEPADHRGAARGRRRGEGRSDADPTTSRPAAPSALCEICGKAFSCQQGLRTHTRQVHELRKYGEGWQPSAPAARSCGQCGKSFRDAEALWQHSLAVHSAGAGESGGSGAHGARGPSLVAGVLDEAARAGSGFAPCSICGMAVPRGMPMEAHLEALKPLVGLALRCACGRAFPEARALEQHRRFCRAAAAGAGAGAGRWCGRWCQHWCARGPWGWLAPEPPSAAR